MFKEFLTISLSLSLSRYPRGFSNFLIILDLMMIIPNSLEKQDKLQLASKIE